MSQAVSGLTPLDAFPGVHVPRELVAESRLDNVPPNRLLDNEAYDKVGNSGTVAADPPMVHFSGFEPGQLLTKVVKIITSAARPQRFHLMPPTTPFFTMRCDKRGVIGPGMYEEVLVTFHAADLRYYADSIRVHCSGQNLVVPIHAYPSMDDVPIPPIVDFGVCEPGERVERLLPLRSSALVRFEFKVEIIEPHGEIDVAPLHGFVPPGGEAHICVGYTPDTFASAHGRFRVLLSQFNFAPVEVVVTGAARPGEAFKKEAARIEARHARRRPQMVRALAEQILAASGELDAALQQEARARRETGSGAVEGAADYIDDGDEGGVGGDAAGGAYGNEAEDDGGYDHDERLDDGPDAPPRLAAPRGFVDHTRGDPVTAARTFASRTALLESGRPLELRFPARPAPRPEREIDGLSIPNDMRTAGATAYVLNQVPGKLKMRDIKKAIAEQRQAATDQEAAVAALAAARAAAAAGAGGARRASRASAPGVGSRRASAAVSRRGSSKFGGNSPPGGRRRSSSRPPFVDESALDLALSTGQRQAKELLFQRELARIAEAEKAKETKAFICIGSDLLPEGAAAATIAARARRAEAEETRSLEALLLRTEPEITAERPLRLLPPEPAAGAAGAAADDGDPGGPSAPPGLLLPGLPVGLPPTFAPQFDRYGNGMSERLRTLEQLRQGLLAIAAVRRVERRLARIEAAAARADAARGAGSVSASAAAAGGGGGGGAGAGGAGGADGASDVAGGAPAEPWPPAILASLLAAPPPRLTSDHIGASVFPRFSDDPIARMPGLPAPPLGSFERLRFFPLRVPRAHELAKHRDFGPSDAPVGIGWYPPVETGRALRTGAADEAGAPLPSGEPDGASAQPLPADSAAAPARAPAGARAMPPLCVTPQDAVWGCGALLPAEAAKTERLATLQRRAAERAAAERAARDAPKSRPGAGAAAAARARAAAASGAQADGEGGEAEGADSLAATKPLGGDAAAGADAAAVAAAEGAGAAAAPAAPREDVMRLPARPRARAPGPRATELDAVHTLQPMPFSLAPFVEAEAVGTGSVRALAAEPLLSASWAQELSPWEEARPGVLPALLSGPLAEDLEPHAEIPEGSPPLALPLPTAELLRESFAVPELDDGGRPLLAADAAAGGNGAGAGGEGEAALPRAAAADAELDALAPQVVPAGTLVLPHDDCVLAARELEKLERRRSAKLTQQHSRLRAAIIDLNEKIVNPRLKLSLS